MSFAAFNRPERSDVLMAITITTNDGLSGLNESDSFWLPKTFNDAAKWVPQLKSGKVTEYKLSDPNALGHPGKLRIESRSIPNIYTLLPVNRTLQAPVKEGQHIYMQSLKVVTRTNTDTDVIQMYPYGVSVVVKIPTDPNVATAALQAAANELIAFAHQLEGPYKMNSSDHYDPQHDLFLELASGHTEMLQTEDTMYLD
jgi:hypothetical protein